MQMSGENVDKKHGSLLGGYISALNSTPAYPSIVVWGAGTDAANGVYDYIGLGDTGEPFWALRGSGVTVNGTPYTLDMSSGVRIGDGSVVYVPADPLTLPWLTTWDVNDGVAPAPFVASADTFFPSSIVVTGIGAGTYTWRGFVNGSPFYNLVGQSTNPGASTIIDIAAGVGDWGIFDADGQLLSESDSLRPFPNLSTWTGSTVSKGTDGVNDGDALVAGAGTAEANGTYYLQVAAYGFHPYYCKIGSDPTVSSIIDNVGDGTYAIVSAADQTYLYAVASPAEFPFSTAWGADNDGAAPAPTVTQV